MIFSLDQKWLMSKGQSKRGKPPFIPPLEGEGKGKYLIINNF